jgi:hypothetical protein
MTKPSTAGGSFISAEELDYARRFSLVALSG